MEKNNSCFVSDTPSWSASNLRPSQKIWSTCGGTYLVGGYGILGNDTTAWQLGEYFSRTYTNLPPHTMLYFTYSWWAIDSWNGSPDSFQVAVDSTVFAGWNTLSFANYPSSQLCGGTGSSNGDLPNIRVFARVLHNSTSATFKMISKLDQISTNEAFGLRDVNFLPILSPSTAGSTESFCGLASVSIGAKQCSCPEGQYLDSTSTCAPCDSACSSCFGSGANQCYECTAGYSFDGINCFLCTLPCTACSGTALNQCYQCTSGYLLYETTCITPSDCPYPLFQNNCNTTCDSPCAKNEFVYANQSCSANCDLPLQQGVLLNTTKLCIYPCNSTAYLYWDGVCESSCPFPLAIRTQVGERYCDYLCAVTDYLYWNGTCSSHCPSPLVTVTSHSRQFCTYPCDTNEYLYPNSSCKTSCKAPYGPRVEAGKNYCDRLCPGEEYMLWKGGCIENCDSPLRVMTNFSGTYCFAPCDPASDYYYPLHETCDSSCDGVQETINGLYKTCSPREQPLSKLLHHIRYVNVTFPWKLENITILRATNVLSPRVVSGMFQKVTSWPDRFNLAPVFEYYLLPSSFLANFADDLLLLGMIVIIGILSFLLEYTFSIMDCAGPSFAFQRIKIVLLWNLPLMMIATNMGDIVFFAITEFRTLDLSSTGALPSLCMCIAMLTIVLAFYTLGFFLVNRAQEVKDEARISKSYNNYATFVLSWEKFQVLFRGYDDKNFFTQSFFLIYCFRLMLPMIIAASLYTIPLLQAISFTIISLAMVFYLLCQRPIIKKIDWINLVIIEFFILVSDASLLSLVVFDMREISRQKARVFFGDVIIVSNYCLSVFAITGLVTKIIITIRAAYDFGKQNKKKQAQSAWLQLFFLPIQQGSLGFEQVQVDIFLTQGKTIPHHNPLSTSIDETSTNIYNKTITDADRPTIYDLDSPSPTRFNFDGGPRLEAPRKLRRRAAPFRPLPPGFGQDNQDILYQIANRSSTRNFERSSPYNRNPSL